MTGGFVRRRRFAASLRVVTCDLRIAIRTESRILQPQPRFRPEKELSDNACQFNTSSNIQTVDQPNLTGTEQRLKVRAVFLVRQSGDLYWPAEICKPTDLPLRYSAIAALFLESRADQTVLCAPESSSASMLCCVNQLEGISNRSSPTRSRNSLSAAASKSCGQ